MHKALTNITKKKKILIPLLIVLVLLGGGTYAYFRLSAKNVTAAQVETLNTVTVKQGDLILYASGSGTLVAAKESNTGFQTSGRVKELNLKVGDKVNVGDVIARMDTTDAEIAVKQAETSLRNLTSAVAIATTEEAIATDIKNIADTKEVLQYQISPNVFFAEVNLSNAEIALEEAQQKNTKSPSAENKAAVDKAQATVERMSRYLKGAWSWYESDYVPDNFTVKTRVEGSRKTLIQILAPSKTDIAAARANYSLAQAQLVEDQYYLAAQKGEQVPDDATGASLKTLEEAKLTLSSAQQALSEMVLTAPISGTITSISAQVGDIVSSGSIITISDMSKLVLDFYLDEADWDKVKTDYPVEVVFDSLPDITFTGLVTSVDPVLNSSSGTTLVKGSAELNGNATTASQNLLLGMNASINVIGGEAKNAILVSVDALHEISPDVFGVYVVNTTGLEFKVVEVGIKDSFTAEVLSGLQAGDIVSTGLLESAQ